LNDPTNWYDSDPIEWFFGADYEDEDEYDDEVEA
jgi:hypothetical protein